MQDITPQTPINPETPPHKSRIYLLVGGVVIVVLALLFTFTPAGNYLQGLFGFVSTSSVVKETTYIGLESGKGVLYTVDLFGINTRSFNEFSVIDYVKAGDVEIAILESDVGRMDVYDVSADMPVALTTDGVRKMSLALSEDALSVAYAVKTRALPVNDADPAYNIYNLPDWDVVVLNLTDKTTALVGPGSHPHFYQDGIFYPAPAGFIWRKPGADGYDEKDEGSILRDDTAYRILRLFVFNSDGSFAFPSNLIPQYNVLKISATNPLHLAVDGTPVTVPGGTRDLIEYKGTYYVIAERKDGRVAIARVEENVEPVVVFTFPSGISPDRFTKTIR